MSGMDLVKFLTARLDEDEQVARAATPGPWSVRPETRSAHSMLYGEADVYGPDGRAVASDRDGGCTSTRDAEHIARHDPARVLREVEAKRRIIDEHRPPRSIALVSVDRELGTRTAADDGTTRCRVCTSMDGRGATRFAGPCPTLRLLALPYDDHPDYRQEWKP